MNMPFYLRRETRYAATALIALAGLYALSKKKILVGGALLAAALAVYIYYFTLIFWTTGNNRNMWAP